VKHWEPLTQWHSNTSRKTLILGHRYVISLNLEEAKLEKYEVSCLVWLWDEVEVWDNDHICNKTAPSLQQQNTHIYRSAPGDKHTKIGNPAESLSPSQTALFHQHQSTLDRIFILPNIFWLPLPVSSFIALMCHTQSMGVKIFKNGLGNLIYSSHPLYPQLTKHPQTILHYYQFSSSYYFSIHLNWTKSVTMRMEAVHSTDTSQHLPTIQCRNLKDDCHFINNHS